jgi:hypothetical protein
VAPAFTGQNHITVAPLKVESPASLQLSVAQSVLLSVVPISEPVSQSFSPSVASTSEPVKRLFVQGKLLGVKFKCLVVSDGFPHWLVALRPMDWSTIQWMQFALTPTNLLPLLETFLPALQKSLAPVSFEI